MRCRFRPFLIKKVKINNFLIILVSWAVFSNLGYKSGSILKNGVNHNLVKNIDEKIGFCVQNVDRLFHKLLSNFILYLTKPKLDSISFQLSPFLHQLSEDFHQLMLIFQGSFFKDHFSGVIFKGRFSRVIFHKPL